MKNVVLLVRLQQTNVWDHCHADKLSRRQSDTFQMVLHGLFV